jgi:hypothetical protein
MGKVRTVQDTPLGFRTDRDPKLVNKRTGKANEPYDEGTVKDCLIEAMLRGVQLVGNQFNIISGRCYITREGYEYLIRRLADVTDFSHVEGVPVRKEGGVTIACESRWRKAGQDQELKVIIPVKSDEYSGADQLLGKAARKFLKRCYEQMTGSVTSDGDVESAAELADVRPQAVPPPATFRPVSVPLAETPTPPPPVESPVPNALSPAQQKLYDALDGLQAIVPGMTFDDVLEWCGVQKEFGRIDFSEVADVSDLSNYVCEIILSGPKMSNLRAWVVTAAERRKRANAEGGRSAP